MTAAHDRVSGTDVLVFAAEMATCAAVALAAGRHAWWWGLLAVLGMAAWWGSLHAPRAAVTLPRAADLGLRGAWFAIGAVALVAVLAGR